MKHTSFITASVLLVAFVLSAAPASAQSRGRVGPRGGSRDSAIGRAVPRRGPAPRIISPRIVRVVPYRSYRYGYWPGLRVGIYSGWGYPYSGYYYGNPYGYGYRFGYGYPYSYSSYGYGYPGYYGTPRWGYGAGVPGVVYGGVRIQSAMRDAEVYADGYYVGIVDDFDGVLQQLNLEAGAHHIEIRIPNAAPIAFDVNVLPGQTITYRADPR